MQAMEGGPTTPIDQVTELGATVIEKLIAAGITTVEALADMTPEQLEEIPGIGEKTMEKIGTAVRHYYGQYEEGEERPAPKVAAETAEPQEAQGEAAVNAASAATESSEHVEEVSIDELEEQQDDLSGDGVEDAVHIALTDLTEAPMVSPEDPEQTVTDIVDHSDPTLHAMQRPERTDHEIADKSADKEETE
jgi:hypothetical protein